MTSYDELHCSYFTEEFGISINNIIKHEALENLQHMKEL